MKTEDVRHLCLCPVCGKLGDEPLMLRVGPMECLAHDRCVFEQFGEGILNLPQEERAKFTLEAVGPDMMRRLLAALNKADGQWRAGVLQIFYGI
jgi:hypothetical protein